MLQLLDDRLERPPAGHGPPPSSVGLRGYAQVDPKVEYKREGMRTFEQMWDSVGERVTDLVFRMEQLDEGFVGSTWSRDRGHARRGRLGRRNRRSSSRRPSTARRPTTSREPIRNRQQRVGRNDPCPCGSGKKFKNCHMRSNGGAGQQ